MPRAKVGKKYIIVRDFRKYPKSDYTENILTITDNGSEVALCDANRNYFYLELRDTMPRLANQLPKAIKRGNDLMFPIPEKNQVIRLKNKVILGVFKYRSKIYVISA